jgi:hypothetical protein
MRTRSQSRTKYLIAFDNYSFPELSRLPKIAKIDFKGGFRLALVNHIPAGFEESVVDGYKRTELICPVTHNTDALDGQYISLWRDSNGECFYLLHATEEDFQEALRAEPEVRDPFNTRFVIWLGRGRIRTFGAHRPSPDETTEESDFEEQ